MDSSLEHEAARPKARRNRKVFREHYKLTGALMILTGCAEPPEPWEVEEPSRYGPFVGAIDDLDGDGAPGFAIGLPPEVTASSVGRVLVVNSSLEVAHELFSPREARSFGWSVISIEDQDKDGVSDLLVGAPARRSDESGRAFVFSGAHGDLLRVISGISAGDYFGYSLCSVGDADEDGISDFLIGAPKARVNGDRAGGPGPGATLLFSGSDCSLLQAYWGDRDGDFFGGAICSLGDVDGDAVVDLAIGAWAGGYVSVVSSSDARRLYQATGWSPWAWFGWAVARVADLDQDGASELLVADPSRDGAVEILSGATGELVRSLRDLVSGGDGGFGASAAVLEDMDGDGFPEIAVGAPGFIREVPGPYGAHIPRESQEDIRRGRYRRGRVDIFSGGSGEKIMTISSARLDDWMGVRLAGIQDMDGDGIADILVSYGAPGFLASVHSGRNGDQIWRGPR